MIKIIFSDMDGTLLDGQGQLPPDFHQVMQKLKQPIQLIRRLIPLECERLQGFPDGWTNVPDASDSPRYKALGNSVAVPCVMFLMQGIRYAGDDPEKRQ